MQLRFTKQARMEFFRIVDVYAEYAGQRSADKIIDKMKKCIESILKYPTASHPEALLADRKRLYRAKMLTKNYRIIYHVTDSSVWIDDIWDGRRHPARLVKRIK